jgi:hypothetical protein
MTTNTNMSSLQPNQPPNRWTHSSRAALKGEWGCVLFVVRYRKGRSKTKNNARRTKVMGDLQSGVKALKLDERYENSRIAMTASKEGLGRAHGCHIMRFLRRTFGTASANHLDRACPWLERWAFHLSGAQRSATRLAGTTRESRHRSYQPSRK